MHLRDAHEGRVGIFFSCLLNGWFHVMHLNSSVHFVRHYLYLQESSYNAFKGVSRAWIGLLTIDTGLITLMIMKAFKRRKGYAGRIFLILFRDGIYYILWYIHMLTFTDESVGTVYYLSVKAHIQTKWVYNLALSIMSLMNIMNILSLTVSRTPSCKKYCLKYRSATICSGKS